MYSLDILNDEIKRAGFINYLLNKTGATLINHIEQFYERIYLENNKKSYQLKEEEQRILIESNWHILEYAEQITTIKQKRLEEKISELEAIQTEQSLENLFQSSFRLIEKFTVSGKIFNHCKPNRGSRISNEATNELCIL